jgi:hypothetical protein
MNSNRLSRQSFLGDAGQATIERSIVGVVGMGGGGSHFAVQLAHIGFMNIVIFDHDVIDESNLNRMVVAIEADVESRTLKTDAAKRRIREINRATRVEAHNCRWQERPEALRKCDLVFGCIDSFAERRELETCCRRYLIPLVDIGMDVVMVGDESPVMGGQVILSMPGGPCMFCLGFLTEKLLALEASKYGAAGPRAQVVWPNGVLASTAVGVAVNLLTDWTRSLRGPVYLEYRGNAGTVTEHPSLKYYQGGRCTHHPVDQVGDPVFVKL